MTDQMTREHVAEIVYEVIHERADQMIRERMAAIVAEVTHEQVAEIVADARAKTLADMTPEDRDACQWMQADVADHDTRYVIANPHDRHGEVALIAADGKIEWILPEYVTPRPDLPRMEWPGDKNPAPAPASALPEGWRLADHPDYGRVIVTNTTPDPSGHVYFVGPADDSMGCDRFFCDPARLTYIDQEADQ